MRVRGVSLLGYNRIDEVALRAEDRAEGGAELLGCDGAKDLLVLSEVLKALTATHEAKEHILPRSQIALGEGFSLVDEEGAGDIGYFAGAGELRLEVFDQLLDELAGQGSIATLHKRLEAEPYEGLGLRGGTPYRDRANR